MQRSSRKIFTAHYAYRNADLNLTPVTGTTNGFIFSNNQFIKQNLFGVSLTCLGCERWILYAFSFIYNTDRYRQMHPQPVQQTLVVLTFHAFLRAEIQTLVNKYECPQRLSFSPGNLFWGSFTNHNTGNYLRHGINITTNQRLSPTFRRDGNTIIVGDSQTSPLPIFLEGGGTSVHRLILGKKDWIRLMNSHYFVTSEDFKKVVCCLYMNT